MAADAPTSTKAWPPCTIASRVFWSNHSVETLRFSWLRNQGKIVNFPGAELEITNNGLFQATS